MENNEFKSITNEEYNTLVGLLDFFDTTRNNLLTFAFTTVLALVGAIIALDNPFSPYLCLFPYLLIIPFTARITYYRLSSAHINSFLRTFAPDKAIFRRGTTVVREKHNWVYHPIAWLINHEMFILAVAVGGIYIYQFCATAQIDTFWDIIKLTLPVPFISVVYMITHSTNSYPKLYRHFQPQWEKYKNDIMSSISEEKTEKTE